MTESKQNLIVAVQFSKLGKAYYFDSYKVTDLKIGELVVVRTVRGWQMGQVKKVVKEDKGGKKRKPVDRRATPRDLMLRQYWREKEKWVVSTCEKVITENKKLAKLKVVSVEYGFTGSILTILVTSGTDERLDVKPFRKKVLEIFEKSSVTVRQIGPRDVAKVMGGIGSCGLEKRCCTRFLHEFCSISIRMAKEQEITLTPEEITGMCGRLRCCLKYEYEHYAEARKEMPKKNKRVTTPLGEGKVISVLPLKGTMVVDIPEVGRREFTKDEVELVTVPQRTRKRN